MATSKRRVSHTFRGLTLPNASHPAIRRVKRQGNHPNIHGTKLWKSGTLLIDYLHRNRPAHCKTVIDAGCGWGSTGIWCAKTLGSQVTSMDADPAVFPFLDVVAELNGVQTEHMVRRFERLTTAELARYDMLVAADVCFWDELVAPMYNLINRAVKAGVKHLIVADPERPPFLELAQRCVDKHYAEVLEWETTRGIEARGALLVIENA